jgi:hypothetical protein
MPGSRESSQSHPITSFPIFHKAPVFRTPAKPQKACIPAYSYEFQIDLGAIPFSKNISEKKGQAGIIAR